MHSPTHALVWQMVWRNRLGIAAALAYLLAAVVLSKLLPANLYIQLEDMQIPAFAWFLGMPVILVNIFFVHVFSLAGTKASDSGFTTHMLVLPVRTGTLVVWPMFFGCFVVAAVWLIVACLVFRPAGIAAPLWWPAAGMIVLLTLMQAMSWTSFSQPWLQIVVTVAWLMAPATMLAIGLTMGVSDALVAMMLLALLPLNCVAALHGVARARRGDAYELKWWSRLMAWLASRRTAVGRPFRSAASAQLWFECRAHAWTLPLFVGSMYVCLACAVWIEPGNVEFGWRMLAISSVWPFIIAFLAGASLGTLHDPYSKQDTAAFLLARPISNTALVRGKIAAAACATLVICLLQIAFVGLIALRPGFIASVQSALAGVPAWKAVGYGLLGAVLMFLFVWKGIIENLWIAFTGRNWVSYAIGVTSISLIFCGIGIGLWVYFHESWHATARAALPWLLNSALLAKLLIAVLVVIAQLRMQLVRPGGAAALIATWCAIALFCFGLAFWLTPTDHFSTKVAFTAIALLLPFSRLAGEMLALEWNRHR